MTTTQQSDRELEAPPCCGLVFEEHTNHAHDMLLFVGTNATVAASLFAVAVGAVPPDPELRSMYEVFDICGAEQFLKLHDASPEVLLIGRAADRAHALDLDFAKLTESAMAVMRSVAASAKVGAEIVREQGDPDVTGAMWEVDK